MEIVLAGQGVNIADVTVLKRYEKMRRHNTSRFITKNLSFTLALIFIYLNKV
jgi:hypothetical protein